MRLPFVFDADSRDGTSDTDERLTNALSETDEGDAVAVIRPALELLTSSVGEGNGVVAFGEGVISVFGGVIGAGVPISTIGAVENVRYDFAQGTS